MLDRFRLLALVAVLFACLIAARCITRTSTVMRSWVGEPVDDLVSNWGAPDSVSKQNSGGRVLTWVTLCVWRQRDHLSAVLHR